MADKSLFCLHILGPDDVIAAPSSAAAQIAADAFNTWWAGRQLDDRYPCAVVLPWPHSADSHDESLLSDWPEYERLTKTDPASLPTAIDRAMAASDKATPGMWHLHTECPSFCCWHLFKAEDGVYGPGDGGLINSPEMSKEDAAFIVSSANLVRQHGPAIRSLVAGPEQTDTARVLTCVYCGHAYPQDTPAHGDQVLTDHIRVCVKHPLRAAEATIERLRSALIGLVGASDPEELRGLEAAVRSLAAPDADKAVTINAIHVLIDTKEGA